MPPKRVPKDVRSNAGQPIKYDEEFIKKTIEDLNEWAAKDDSIIFAKWIASRGHTYEWCWEMCEAFPIFSKAFSNAKLTVGARREEEAYKGKANVTIVTKTLHNYDPSLVKTEKELRSVDKSDDEDKKPVINIINYSDKLKVETSEGE